MYWVYFISYISTKTHLGEFNTKDYQEAFLYIGDDRQQLEERVRYLESKKSAFH